MKYQTKTHVDLTVLMLLCACAGSANLGAATIFVSNTADSGAGSLRAALVSAANGDTIDATGVSGTITLTSGELLITNTLIINGPGPASLAINGNYPQSANRVFDVTNRVSVTISGLTITNGHAFEGGGILNYQSALTVSNCVVSGNSSDIGGGILSNAGSSGSARLTIVNSTLSGNSASIVGGAIYNWGEPGSAILAVIGSTIRGNSAGAAGSGGIKNDGSPSGNAMAAITNSTISGNSTTGSGGGIHNDGLQGSATLTIVNSTLSGNTAGPDLSAYGGGGIYNEGGSGGSATVTLINTTLSGNSTGALGGGIRNGASGGGTTTLTLLSSTIASNSAPGLAGNIFNIGQINIGNTILSAGSSSSNITSLSGGTVASWGYNLSSDGAGGSLTNATDRTNINPLLGPLQDNGGPAFTHALLAGSPAIDQGKNLSGDATDERGIPRVYDNPAIANAAGGDGTDIGAYETSPLRISVVGKDGNDLRLEFISMPGVNYELQIRNDLAPGLWSSVPGIIAGNGSISQITVSNAFNQPQQLYRIHQLP